MDLESLRALYLRDTENVPEMRAAIKTASTRPDRTLVLQFEPFDDNPMLLYAVWGLASLEGVTIVLPPKR